MRGSIREIDDLPNKVRYKQEEILSRLAELEDPRIYPNLEKAFASFCSTGRNREQLLAVIDEFEITHAAQDDLLPSHFEVFGKKLSWVVNTHSLSIMDGKSDLYPVPGTFDYWIEVFYVVTELISPPTTLVKWDSYLRDL